jgi:hypothetical protein
MELRTVGGRLKFGGVFRLVATGYAIGAGVIFLPMFALMTLISLPTGAATKVNGEVVNGVAGQALLFLPFLMAPFIVAMQALMVGAFIVFGLWLYQKRRPLRVVAEEDLDRATAIE